jgi:hypothetical protein
MGFLNKNKGKAFTSAEVAEGLGQKDSVETIHWVLAHLGANPKDHKLKVKAGKTVFDTKYSA